MSLSITNLSSGYGKTSAVKGLTADAKAGDFIGLVGPNGAGKSCLLKTIAGLIKPSDGQIEMDGISTATRAPKARAKQIAYLAQERRAAWPFPVSDLVALGRAPYRGPLGMLSADDEAAIEAALIAAQCEDLKDRRFDQLSGGEQARVYLARALAVDAPLLLADEPTASLDPYYQLSLLETLRAETKRGKNIIASLHDLTLAKQYCTRIWVMDGGKLVEDLKANAALSPRTLARVFKIKLNNGIASVQTPKKN